MLLESLGRRKLYLQQETLMIVLRNPANYEDQQRGHGYGV